MIVREDIARARSIENGPSTGEELAVDDLALADAARDYGKGVGGFLGWDSEQSVFLAAAWAHGFMTGVRAAREDAS